MEGIAEVRDALVRPIHSEEVLHQVVRSDAEELRFLPQQIGGRRRRRHLQHGADRHFPKRRVPMAQRPNRRPDVRPRRPELLKPAHHREHQLDLPVDGGTQYRPNLGLENPGRHHQQPRAAQSERGIQFRRTADVSRREIERPNHQRVRFQGPGQVPVDPELFFLGRNLLDGNPLGTEETDSLGAVAPDEINLARFVHVGHQEHPLAVGR